MRVLLFSLRACTWAVVGLCLAAYAQEKPASLTGALSTGFYSTTNRNPEPAKINFVPLSATLDWKGYLVHPDFLSYEIQPEGTLGPQATEAGFLGGNGVRASTTFLNGRSFPLTLFYNNIQREDVFFGSLTQLSGFRSFNRDRNYGLNWQWRKPLWPHLTFDAGSSRLSAEPHLALIPDYHTRTRHYTLNGEDDRWGWSFHGLLRRDRLDSDYINVFSPDRPTLNFDQHISESQVDALRPLWPGSQYSISAGVLKFINRFDGRPFDQTVRFVHNTLSFGERSRLRGNLRAGYSSNLLGTEIQQALNRLAGGGGSVTGAPEALLFSQIRTRISSLETSGGLRYRVLSDWDVFGQLTNNRVRAPQTVLARGSEFLSGNAGVDFHHAFSWANVTSQYSHTLGRLVYSGLPGRLSGDSLSASAQHGAIERLQITGSFSGTRQVTRQIMQYRAASKTGDLTLAHRIHAASLTLRAGAGLEQSYFRDDALKFNASGLTWHADAEHPMFQLSYSHNGSNGTTLQGLLANPAGEAAASALLLGLPLRPLLSLNRGDILMARASPIRRMEFSFTRLRGRQRFDRQLINDYDQVDFRAAYRFRQLRFEAGYIRWDQSFALAIPFERSRLFFRVTRPFQVF